MLRAIMRRYAPGLATSVRRQITGARRYIARLPEIRRRKLALAHMEEIIARRPLRVSVETTTICNSRCVFCAYPKVKRPKSILSLRDFRRVCEGYAELGGGFLGLAPTLSDPLTDPLLFDRIKLVQRNFQTITLHLYTNGIRFASFSDEQLDILCESMEHIDVSIGGFNRTDYKTMFGVDKFDRVWRGLKRLSEANRRAQAPTKLYMHIRTHRIETIDGDPLFEELGKMGFKITDIANSFSEWGGIVSSKDLPEGATVRYNDNTKQRSPCLLPMTYLGVRADGTCTGCACMDATNQFELGNVDELSVVARQSKLDQMGCLI
jgi:hypothetical protein